MTKDEAERGIRYLCGEWAKQTGVMPGPNVDPDFGGFMAWVRADHSAYLNFRTTTSVGDDVERWFDQEFKQAWRN